MGRRGVNRGSTRGYPVQLCKYCELPKCVHGNCINRHCEDNRIDDCKCHNEYYPYKGKR